MILELGCLNGINRKNGVLLAKEWSNWCTDVLIDEEMVLLVKEWSNWCTDVLIDEGMVLLVN